MTFRVYISPAAKEAIDTSVRFIAKERHAPQAAEQLIAR